VIPGLGCLLFCYSIKAIAVSPNNERYSLLNI
jgi:hypothetical protein